MNVNEEMVKSALAWHYRRFSKDERLAEFENRAREVKFGLLADKSPISPSAFRTKKASVDQMKLKLK